MRQTRSPSAAGRSRSAVHGVHATSDGAKRGRRSPPMSTFSSTEVLGQMAMEKMLAKLSTRRYKLGLEPVGERGRSPLIGGKSRSAVSRRFVEATETALAELLASDLSDLDLVAFMVDGVHFADHLCVVALGIDVVGVKHPLAVVEGDTENTTVVKDLLVGLRDRGLDMTRPILVVIDGGKALHARAVHDGLRPPRHRPLPTPQDQKCRRRNCRKGPCQDGGDPGSTRSITNDDALRAAKGARHPARRIEVSIPGRRQPAQGLTETLTIAGSVWRRPWHAPCARPTPSSR